jgi:F-type H+-transporting ATPase subunit alpha
VAVKKVKEFEAQFLLEMETKLPHVLAEFKKGQLNEGSIAEMTELAKGIASHYK